mgnify:FL=1|jgi:hypothetical protein
MEYRLVYQLFPRSFGVTEEIKEVISCFEKNYEQIKSPDHNLSSDGVLKVIADDLELLSFKVEKSKASIDKIKVPVLFGVNNRIDKFFDADAVSKDGKIVIEVEAGRGFRNNQFLKDIFQACMMPNVEYLVIAVRNHYHNSDDFKSIFQFLETLYISGRLQLPLKGIVLIGY